jgi:Sulfotransferase family
LGIGAHKAGTTWLWSMLRAHPGIWTAPLKELHYFDRSLRYASANFLAADSLLERLVSRAPHNREFRRTCAPQLSRAIRTRDWPLLRWYTRYYFGGRGDRWYLSLFAEGSGRLCGEVTPAYAMLEAEDVARIHRLAPNVKIIFLLRNPVERAWSHIRFEWMEGRFTGMHDLAQVRQLIEHPGVTLRGDYLRTLEIWESKFPREQMFIGFFDDIMAQPSRLLRQVYSFLGLQISDVISIPGNRKVHASHELDMPAEIRRYLARKYLPDLEKLSVRFGGHAQLWHSDAVEIT